MYPWISGEEQEVVTKIQAKRIRKKFPGMQHDFFMGTRVVVM
jgi:hypothetical protein